MFHQVTIIGFGLIGSSIARALQLHHPDTRIICADRSEAVCQRALVLGLAHKATTDLADSVVGSDLVILCTPVGACRTIAQAITPSLQSGAIVSDVGSVKQAVLDAMLDVLPDHVDFVPGHPIAGTEHSGPDAGFAELFVNRWMILTPPPGTNHSAVQKLFDLWRSFGSKPDIMEAKHHDLVLGITSHLPHLIAYTIVGTATSLGEDIQSEVIQYSAGGFRDFTRIAASDPTMWRDVFLYNREAVLDLLQRFTEDLTEMQKAIRRGEGQKLFDYFSKTRNIRRSIIDQGQAAFPAKQLATWQQPTMDPYKSPDSES